MDPRDGRYKVENLVEVASIVFNAPPDTDQKIRESHSPNDSKMDVWPILHIVEKIFTRAPLNVVITGILDMDVEVEVEMHHRVPMPEKMDEEAYQDRKREAEAIYIIMNRISSELAGKSLESRDEHKTTMSLLNMLSGYSWDAKLILTLAAFALNYGEFILKQILPVLKDDVYGIFDGLREIIKTMLELARCIVAFKTLPNSMFMRSVGMTSSHTMTSHESDAWSNANKVIPLAVYYTVISVVICAKTINVCGTCLGHESETASSLLGGYFSIRSLANFMNLRIFRYLHEQLVICSLNIDEKKKVAAYESLVRCIDENHTDNMKVLKALICSKDGMQPIFDCSSKAKVHVDVLKSKNVLLLISSLDNYQEELSILKSLYDESRQHFTAMDSTYKVVWVPIVDLWKEDPMQNQFETLRSTMPWYTAHHPEIIDDVVKRLVKERWNFKNKPILVVLDPRGRVVSPNALHMMWIWGTDAFPFTSSREEALWKSETWRLKLLVNDIDPMVLGWIGEGKYIFLYGGSNIEWIRKFTSEASSMARTACIPLEMVYVENCAGKKEKMRRVMAIITAENLSHTWQDAMIRFFWTRLESMLFSKIQLEEKSGTSGTAPAVDNHDPMIQDIKKLLSCDKDGGWAMLSHGNEVLVNGNGATVLSTLSQYETWKEQIPEKGFDMSLKDHYVNVHRESPHCCRFEFSSTVGRIPENYITCPECVRKMEEYTIFLCCDT